MKPLNVRRFYFGKTRAGCLGIRFLGCGHEKGFVHNDRTVHRFGVSLAIKGRAAITLHSDTRYTVKAGDLFLYFPRDHFSLAPGPDYEELWVLFDGAVLRQYMYEFPRHVPKKHASSAAPVVRNIWRLSGAEKPDFQSLALLTWDLIGRLAKAPGERVEKPHGTGSDPVGEILDLVRADPAEQWDFQELAEQRGISYALLRLRVKERTGLPIGEFHSRERINKACVLLAKGYPVKQAAGAVGISNPLYFSRFFKKRTAQTPSGYRTMHAVLKNVSPKAGSRE